MIGDAIESVRQGVETLITELRSNPHTLETAHVSIITFDSQARQIIPLTEVSEIVVPELKLSPGTAMGAGIRMLCDKVNQEVTKTTATQKGDYRPLVFLLTDGQPTDPSDAEAAIRTLTSPKIANIYAIGCGSEGDVDFHTLGKITDIVLKMEDLSREAFAKLFVWLSSSVQSTSIDAANPEAANKVNLDKLPAEVTKVDPATTTAPLAGRPLQVFVKAYCSNAAHPGSSAPPSAYLMRFRLNEQYNAYEPTNSHKLDGEMREGAGVAQMPSFSSDMLMGPANCAYCHSPGAGACSCGAVFCLSNQPAASVTCPVCKNTLNLRSGGGFDITGSAG